MFYAILFCAVISVASARPKDQQVYHLSPDRLLKVQHITQSCMEKHKADPDILRNILDATLVPDDVSKNFLYCFAFSGNFINEEGHFNIPRMLDLLGDHPLKEPFAKQLAICNNITKENPVETAYAMNLCFNNDGPVVFAI